MALFRAHTRGHIVAEINVTPLTDVFLVLLIIFMITTSAMVKPAADVDLPKAPESQEEAKGVMVTITPSKGRSTVSTISGGGWGKISSKELRRPSTAKTSLSRMKIECFA